MEDEWEGVRGRGEVVVGMDEGVGCEAKHYTLQLDPSDPSEACPSTLGASLALARTVPL